MPEATSGLAIERDGDCWMIELDRPAVANALSAELVESLINVVAQADAAGARLLCFRGRGRNLCAGFDFAGFESQSEADLLQRFVRIELLLQAIASSPSVTLGFAHGANFGAGVDLLAACRWRVADPAATFRMPGLAFGVVLGTRRFANLVGHEPARDILEGLVTFDAVKAQALGFLRKTAAMADWPKIVDEARVVARTLTAEARQGLHRALNDGGLHDRDLAHLVRSAAVPGLKRRMQEYRAALRS